MQRTLLDPTSEANPAMRERRAPPTSIDGITVGLLDIGKRRSDEFLDQVEVRLAERGLKVRRYAKPTNARVAPEPVKQAIAAECDVVVEGLAD